MQVIRPLLPFEASLLGQHFMRLAEEERYSRFAGPASEPVVERYVKGLEWTRAVRLGCFVDGMLRGLAELVMIEGADAELAVTVEPPYQHHGIASALMSRILLVARNRGIRRVVAYCLADNQHMRGLVRKFTGRMHFDGANAEASFSPGVPSPLSYWHEAVQTADSWIGSIAQGLLGHVGLPLHRA